MDRLHVSSESATSWGAGISPTAHFTAAVPSDSRRPLRTGWAVLDYGRQADAAMMVQATDLGSLGRSIGLTSLRRAGAKHVAPARYSVLTCCVAIS